LKNVTIRKGNHDRPESERASPRFGAPSEKVRHKEKVNPKKVGNKEKGGKKECNHGKARKKRSFSSAPWRKEQKLKKKRANKSGDPTPGNK